jgi:hypothetical protein
VCYSRFRQPRVEVIVRRVLSVVGFLFFLTSFVPSQLHAQRAAAGASFTRMALTYPDGESNGFGGWLSWDLAGSGLGADVSVSLFPEDDPITGRQTQLLAGVRSGLRTGPIGVFGRVRPGFLHFGRRFYAPDIACILIFPPPESCLTASTVFSLDLGGTVEVYPASSAVVRIDVGDTLIRFPRGELDATWKHNFQFAAGAGVRF